MSKRPSESNSPPVKHIKSSSGLDQEDQNGNQGTSQDSGYSGSQGMVVQPMDLEESIKQGSKADVSGSGYEGSQGQDVQPMDFDNDEKGYQTVPCPEQGSDVMDGSSPSKRNIPDIFGIRVDEDSNQESCAGMMKRTDEKRRYFAENVLHCTVTMKQNNNKKKINEEGSDDEDSVNPQDLILMNACALLNSGGGVLVIKNKDSQSLSHNTVDKFWQSIESKLKGMLKASVTYDEVFDRCVDCDEILLFISASQHLCTIEYNLFLPGDAGNYEATYDQMVKLLQKESAQGKKRKSSTVDVPLNDLPTFPRTFRFNEKFSHIESKQIQLKNFTSKTYLDSNNRTQCQGIRKHISAFANGSGGVILLGVTDDSSEVRGLNINEKNSKEEIEKRVIAIVEKMVLPCCNFTLQRKVHWDMNFIPVSDTESNAVVVISVAGMGNSGGVFTKCPKSFELKSGDDGRKVPCPLNFEEWKKGMLSGLELQSNSKAMDAMFSKFDKLKVSERLLLTFKGGVQKIKDAFFHVEDGFPVTPHGFESNLPQEAQDVIKKVQKKCSMRGSNRGLIVAHHSWLSNLEVRPVEGFICDLLIVSRNLGGLHLLTLCHGDDDDKKILEYSREVSQTIKTRLVREGACTQKFYVSPHVVPCTGTKTELAFLPDKRYPRRYHLDVGREKLNDVLKALVIILATVPSALSGKLGVCFMNLLTKEQFQLLHEQIEKNRELFIHGAAGTGKTLVAVEFMRELKRREKLENEEILYVCTTEGLANQIREKDVCRVVSQVSSFENGEFGEVRHVVLDETQNYEFFNKNSPFGTDVPLYQKARHLVRQHHQDRPGYLWIFTDKCQSDHNFPTGLPDVTQQTHQFKLTKVIRNSKQIFDFSKKYRTKDGVVGPLEIGHDFDGQIVERTYADSDKESQMDVLTREYQSLRSDGWEDKEIAVLFLTGRSRQNLRGVFPFKFCNAEGDNTDSVVVSVSLEYRGLDRAVVILLGIDDLMEQVRGSRKKVLLRNNHIYCAVTRAMVKLIIIRCKYTVE